MSDEVKGPDGGSFMVIEKQVPSVAAHSGAMRQIIYRNERFMDARRWLHGGPFISYAFIDSATTRAVVVTASFMPRRMISVSSSAR
jgi:hypothetical protein